MDGERGNPSFRELLVGMVEYTPYFHTISHRIARFQEAILHRDDAIRKSKLMAFLGKRLERFGLPSLFLIAVVAVRVPRSQGF